MELDGTLLVFKTLSLYSLTADTIKYTHCMCTTGPGLKTAFYCQTFLPSIRLSQSDPDGPETSYNRLISVLTTD